MTKRTLSLAAVVCVIGACDANAQFQSNCSGPTCTFTLTFDGPWLPWVPLISGAAYSGQQTRQSQHTLADGTHTSGQSLAPTIYRDPKGRVRIETPVYNAVNGRPVPPDNFTVVEIRDPVAGFEYILDPVNRVAHRMARQFDPVTPVNQWELLNLKTVTAASTVTRPNGATVTTEPLGPESMFGAAAIGSRTTRTSPPQPPNIQSVTSSDETWFDPRTGVTLLEKNTTAMGDINTTTMASYSADEPDPALFQIPGGYQIVNETGTFKVVHARTNASGVPSSSGSQGPRSIADCEDNSCTLTFNLASPNPIAALTGAPYSGSQTIETAARTQPNGMQIPARTITQGTVYRDSAGRTHMEKVPVQAGGARDKFNITEIDDPVAGYQYILDNADHVAHRVQYQARIVAFRPVPPFQPAGTRTWPDGTVTTEEDLGEQTIGGIAAVGHRSTQTQPVGSNQGNDKPIVTVSERWVDPQTGITVLSKQSGSYGGNTMSIPDYKPGEPDSALFQIPPNYKIVDEAAKFSFVVPRGN